MFQILHGQFYVFLLHFQQQQTKEGFPSRESTGRVCQVCSLAMLSMPCSEVMKVPERERLGQPGAGGILENRVFDLDLEEKTY